MIQKLKIVFFGSQDFAVPTLKALFELHEIAGIVTAPDHQPPSKKKKPIPTPVKHWGVEHNIPIITPNKLKAPSFLQQLKEWNADLFVVVAFKKLPKVVWTLPPLGTINLHASLLPYYRGAAPIHWAVVNGENFTGLTTFFINEKIDAGNILLQLPVKIEKHWNTGTLYDILKQKGAELILTTLQALINQNILPKQQKIGDDKVYPKAPKIIPQKHCLINWEQPAEKVYNLIRGFAPIPGAFTYTSVFSKNNEKALRLKIYQCSIVQNAAQYQLPEGKPGEIKILSSHLFIKTLDKWLAIEELQLEGRKKMKVQKFLRGFAKK